jgi:hypothetical protein
MPEQKPLRFIKRKDCNRITPIGASLSGGQKCLEVCGITESPETKRTTEMSAAHTITMPSEAQNRNRNSETIVTPVRVLATLGTLDGTNDGDVIISIVVVITFTYCCISSSIQPSPWSSLASFVVACHPSSSSSISINIFVIAVIILLFLQDNDGGNDNNIVLSSWLIHSYQRQLS